MESMQIRRIELFLNAPGGNVFRAEKLADRQLGQVPPTIEGTQTLRRVNLR